MPLMNEVVGSNPEVVISIYVLEVALSSMSEVKPINLTAAHQASGFWADTFTSDNSSVCSGSINARDNIKKTLPLNQRFFFYNFGIFLPGTRII